MSCCRRCGGDARRIAIAPWTCSCGACGRKSIVTRHATRSSRRASVSGTSSSRKRSSNTPTQNCSRGDDLAALDRGSLPRVEFELTPEQREIQAVARELATAEIEPYAADWDRAHAFPRELLDKLAELGLLGVCVPEAHGGAGADFMSYILVLE